jgi:hypothetical protein
VSGSEASRTSTWTPVANLQLTAIPERYHNGARKSMAL